jgi:hypothetical protein
VSTGESRDALDALTSGEPTARRTIFAAFRHAAVDRFGEAGVRAIAERMTPECRAACIDAVVLSADFLPEKYVLEWYQAAWEGPALRDRAAYDAFLDRMIDHGFGRVRKFLLGIATPELIARKSAELWRHDHTHGELTHRMLGGTTFVLCLRDHPYLSTPLARSSIAEIYRHCTSLCRVSNVRASHRLEGEVLEVRIEWQ